MSQPKVSQIQSPERNLLNEIAHLTNLLESSKKRKNVGNSRAWKVQTFHHPKKTYSSTNLKRVNFHSLRMSRVPKRLCEMPTTTTVVSFASSKLPLNPVPVSLPLNELKSSSGGAKKGLPTKEKGGDGPKRYYAIEPSSSPIQAIVQRRLPPDVVEVRTKNRGEDAVHSDTQEPLAMTFETETRPSPSISGSAGNPTVGDPSQSFSTNTSSQSVLEHSEVRAQAGNVEVRDEGYQLRRSRLLTQLSKLSSYKERFKGPTGSSSQLPSYLPC